MSAAVRPVGPCPSWCDLPTGHDWWGEEAETGRISRRHSGPTFQRGDGPIVEAEAVEYADETEIRSLVVRVYDVNKDLHPFDAHMLARSLEDAYSWIASVVRRQWWQDAPNPACRSWCTDGHDEDEFRDGALMLCRTWVDCDSPIVESVEIAAITAGDDTPGAVVGALRWEAPTIEVHLVNDGRDDMVTTPEGFEQAAVALPSAIAQARRIVATDEHATPEQRAAVVA